MALEKPDRSHPGATGYSERLDGRTTGVGRWRDQKHAMIQTDMICGTGLRKDARRRLHWLELVMFLERCITKTGHS